MKIIVSACLLGVDCKYNGSNNRDERVIALGNDHELIPVCPEMEGGLPCPRIPCEICRGKTLSKDGKDFTREYEMGAKLCLKKALDEKAELAILQPRSPSCGVDQIYDGTFSGQLIDGDGVFASMLKSHKIPVVKPNSISVVNDKILL